MRELARTTRELRARTAVNSPANCARRARLARGSPRLSMPHSYSTFLVNNKIKVQMGVSSALFLFLCVNWFTARVAPVQRREGSVSGAAVADCPVQHMQHLSKCGIQSRLQQALIGRNATSSRRKAPHRGGDNRSPKASKRSLAAPPPSFENRSSLSTFE